MTPGRAPVRALGRAPGRRWPAAGQIVV